MSLAIQARSHGGTKRHSPLEMILLPWAFSKNKKMIKNAWSMNKTCPVLSVRSRSSRLQYTCLHTQWKTGNDRGRFYLHNTSPPLEFFRSTTGAGWLRPSSYQLKYPHIPPSLFTKLWLFSTTIRNNATSPLWQEALTVSVDTFLHVKCRYNTSDEVWWRVS